MRREAGALGRTAVRHVPRDPHKRDVDDAGDLLGHDGKQVLRLHALRHEGRNAAQRAQLVIGHMQLGGPLGHLDLERVASLAELVFCPFPLVDEARALERGGGVICSEGQQQLVHRRGKVAAFGGGGNHTSLAVDADRDGEAGSPRRVVADVGNDLLAREWIARGEAAFKPFRKARPRAPPRHLDRSATTGVAQAHEGKIELQQADQCVGEPGRHRRRLASDPHGRDRRQRHEVPQHRLQAGDLGVGIDVHSDRRAAADVRLLLP